MTPPKDPRILEISQAGRVFFDAPRLRVVIAAILPLLGWVGRGVYADTFASPVDGSVSQAQLRDARKDSETEAAKINQQLQDLKVEVRNMRTDVGQMRASFDALLVHMARDARFTPLLQGEPQVSPMLVAATQ